MFKCSKSRILIKQIPTTYNLHTLLIALALDLSTTNIKHQSSLDQQRNITNSLRGMKRKRKEKENKQKVPCVVSRCKQL